MIPRTILLSCGLLFTCSSCSPLRSSPSDGQHLFELNLHEVQTNLDDLRHDIHCFQTELQILEGRIKSHEQALASMRENDLQKQQVKLDQLQKQIQSFEKSWTIYEKGQNGASQELKQLTSHANETIAALTQFKTRILELEREIIAQNQRFDELAKVRGTLESLAKTVKNGTESARLYRVKKGDTLEQIAKAHDTTVEKIKKWNQLDKDFISIGQQLKIPPHE